MRKGGAMKTAAYALILTLAASATGCSAYRSYTYSSPEGKTCLSMCEEDRWACRTRCGKDTVCLNDCEEAAAVCRKNCPAVSVEEPGWTR